MTSNPSPLAPIQFAYAPGFDAELIAVARELTARAAKDSLRWAWATFRDRCVILSSMQDTVVIDLAQEVAPEIPIAFLDNGFQFPQTLDTVKRVEDRYGIRVEVVRPQAEVAPTDSQEFECCDLKPGLLNAALAGKDAWISGIQRVATAERSSAKIVERDHRGKTKINPLVHWSHEDRIDYIQNKGLVRNPLLDEGFDSIGCMPCTKPSTGEYRSGRWAASSKTECGLHHRPRATQ